MPDVLPTANWREKLLLILRRRTAFAVDGESMAPVLTSGDKILIDPLAAISVGDIALARHPYERSTRLIKRVTEISDSGLYFLTGDNANESTDSRTFGKISRGDIIGKVVCKL